MEENNHNWISYSYKSGDESDLEDLLILFEKKIGGKREPYYSRSGAIDIVSFFEIFIPFTSGVVITLLLEKYFEGLLDTDELTSVGKKHKTEIIAWYKNVESNIKKLLSPIAKPPKKVFSRYTNQQTEKAAALRVSFGKIECYIVLNHSTINERLIENLPYAITSIIEYLKTSGLPEETHVLQLYYDIEDYNWKYLFLPTANGFGNFIDRYVDLTTGELVHLNSPDDFVNTFLPVLQDRYKFLVNPFRYNEKG